MIKSMTAYGQAIKSTSVGRWMVEIHSVNRKSLDIHLNLPKEFLRFDLDMRKWISKRLLRGQVSARVTQALDEGTSMPSLHTLRSLKEKWERVAHELGYDPKHMIDLSFLVEHMPQTISVESCEEELRLALQAATEQALSQVMSMKEREGYHLVEDFRLRLAKLETAVEVIKTRCPQMIATFRESLQERLHGLFPLTQENEERFFREIAFFADKGDVSEELVRLESHIKQFRHYLECEEEALGKTLDFLTQEIHREINTLGAKALDSEMSHRVVTMKSECEKIREQVQNIE